MDVLKTHPEIVKAREEIRDRQNLIASIQGHCHHPRETLNKQTDCNTGNYDPSQDVYWTEYHCLICDKMWEEYQ